MSLHSEARLAAARAGEFRFEGKPCIHCGGTLRHTSSGACIACVTRKSNAKNAKIRDLLKQSIEFKRGNK